MIERQMVGGRQATVADYEGMLKVIFDDGDVLFLTPVSQAKVWDESQHPRVPAGSPEGGQFGEGGGGGGGESGGTGSGDHPGHGYSASAYVDKHGVIHTSSVYDATRALFENRKVELNQPKGVSTLIHHLGQVAKTMAQLGDKAPTFDLCNVSVKGTNLFCAESKGIPRVEMPQMDRQQTKDFVQHLKDEGYKVKKDREHAANLRATQDQLNGAKVAANMEKQEGGKEPRRIIISKDDYILDGHHKWAAAIGIDAQNNRLRDDKEMKVYRVNIKIVKLLEEAQKFTGGKGAKPVDERSISEEELYAYIDQISMETKPMPLKPNKGESQSDFISRCMHEVYGTDAPKDRTQEQAVAICYSYWRDAHGKAKQVTPQADEDEDTFMDRCVQECLDSGECDTVEDARDECADMWEERKAPMIHKTHVSKGSGLDFILSDATPDRFGDVIDAEGWQLENFQKNPIALFNHRADFPIGKWHSLQVKEGTLRGRLELAPKGTSARIDEIRSVIEAGILRATSVGFLPIKSRAISKTAPGEFYERCELVETSVVCVPANPNALAVAKNLKVSAETMKMVFAEQGDRKPSVVTRAANGKHADDDKAHRGNGKMSPLAQRITDLETQIVAKRDLLEDHLNKMDDSNVSDADLETTGKYNADIAQMEKLRESLVNSEKLLAKSAQGGEQPNGKGRALSTVVVPSAFTPSTPAVIKAKSKDLDLFDYIVRGAVVTYVARATNKSPEETRQRIYGEDDGTKAMVEIVTRAASAPALTTVAGWAQELAQTTYADLMPLLMPKSIMTRLAPRGLTLSFGSSGRIVIPTRSATPTIAGSFVGEGLAIPVRQGAFTSQTLTPKKMAVISTWTREMGDHSIPAIEGLIREAIQQDTSVAIDSVLIDANAATTIRPAGLLNGVSVTTATTGGGIAALIGDITKLVNAISTNTKGNIRNLVWLANQTDMYRASLLTAANTGIFPFRDEIARGTLNGIPIIDSATVTAQTLILVDAADFVVVGGEAPRMEISDQATLHMEDTSPADLVASPSTVAAPQRSLFQTDSLALRMVMPLNWTQRRTGTVAWTQTVTW